VPISIGGEVLGVLDVQEDEKGALQEPDVEVMQTFANQVAVALRNARLFEASRQQAQQEAQINEITQRIQQTTDMASAMQIAIRELGRATGVQAVHVRLHQQPAGNGHEGK
jgi:GAF domain-containing protein